MRTGLDARTGAILQGWDECAQSIGFIARTAIGSLVLGRSFGSKVPALQDAPMNQLAIMAHFMAIAEALRRWEPGYRLTNVKVISLSADGVASFTLTGVYYPNGYLGDYSIALSGYGVTVLTGGFPS